MNPQRSNKMKVATIGCALSLAALVTGIGLMPSVALAAKGHGAHQHNDHQHGAASDSAIGEPGQRANVTRTVNVTMSDRLRFNPARLQVKQGETIRFAIRNQGQLKHEFSLGTESELLEHLEVMRRFPDMEHDEPNKITLQPKEKGEIIWRFTRAGTVDFGCLIPGHYEGGMKGQIKVSARQ